jgi:hypothetical protein
VALGDHIFLPDSQLAACGEVNLLLNQVNTRDGLGDGMLYLNPRIDLKEVEGIVFDEELYRRHRAVVDASHELGGGLRDLLSQAIREEGRRGLLDDLLVPTLQRAISRPDVDAAPSAIGGYLNLDMPRTSEVLLKEHLA